MKRTKIVCTLGPASEKPEHIEALIKAGMNVARINMSHGDYEEHGGRIKVVREVATKMGVPVAILADTKGPEIRLKTFAEGKVMLVEGDKFSLMMKDVVGDQTKASITYTKLPSCVKKGDQILIDDGKIELRAEKVTADEITCTVINGGKVSDKKSLNLPGCKIDMPYMSEVDKKDVEFAISQKADFLAMSFVRNGDDVKIMRKFMADHKETNMQLIAKVENRQGVDNLDEILELSDGAMVARGDMGVEIPFQELPSIQKLMIKKGNELGKKIITATQMLDSMIDNPRPTRAEISDVANAIYDGTTAIMLSGESAVGKYPSGAVTVMTKIAQATEADINYVGRFKEYDQKLDSVTATVCHATVAASYNLNAAAIIAVSKTGYTSREVSRFRPTCPIICVTSSPEAFRQMGLNWGVTPLMGEEKSTAEELFNHAIEVAKKSGKVKKGDTVILVGGTPVGVPGNTNSLRIETVK